MARKTAFLSVKYLEPHQNGLRYKRRIPERLKAEFGGKTSWTKNFPPSWTEVEIVKEVTSLSAKHTAMIKEKRNRKLTPQERFTVEFDAAIWTETSTDDELRDMLERFIASKGGAAKLTAEESGFVAAVGNEGKVPAHGPLLSVAAIDDAARYGQNRNARPFSYAVDLFIKSMGDKKVTEIARSDVAAFIDMNSHLAPATVTRAVGTLRGLVKRCYRDMEIEKRNPFAEQFIANSSGGAEDRLPFNRAMLDVIDHHVATYTRLGHETKNIIRIMKLTGGGPAEIGGLSLADIILDAEIPHIWIKPNNIRRRLKVQGAGSVRKRQVPLIGDALEAVKDALSHTVDRALGEKAEYVALFTVFGQKGRGADAISQNVNKAVRKAGVPKSKRLSGYSFRHTMKEALREANIPETIQRRLLGHSGEGVASRYGSKHGKLAVLREALIAALPHLGDIERSNYTTAEWLD